VVAKGWCGSCEVGGGVRRVNEALLGGRIIHSKKGKSRKDGMKDTHYGRQRKAFVAPSDIDMVIQ
jgi:hypothetical protein